MMPELVQTTKKDLALVLDYMEAFCAIDSYPFNRAKTEESVLRFLQNEQLGSLWLIEENSQTVGYLVLTFGFSFEYGGRDAFIDEFFLAEGFRDQGIGSQVMQLLEEEAKKLKVQAIHLEVEPHNAQGNRIYQKAGYASKGRTLLTKTLG